MNLAAQTENIKCIFISCLLFSHFSQPEIFFDVVSLSTWQEVLSDSQREHLQQFLPQFPTDNVEQQNELILALFSGENFRFGNPLHIAQKLFRGL